MKIYVKVANIVLPLLLLFFVFSTLYESSVTFGKVLKAFLVEAPSFFMSSFAIVPAVVISYRLSKRSVLKRSNSGIFDALVSDLPVFVVASILQIFVWTRIFLISSYHTFVLDTLSSFIPTFLTFILIMFIQFKVSMYPIAIRLKKSEFVRTYRSIGMSDKDINKRLSKNIDIEVSKSVKNVVLMALGESLVVENLYNFRGIGYEMLNSLKESNFTNVAGILIYIAILILVLSLLMERNVPE